MSSLGTFCSTQQAVGKITQLLSRPQTFLQIFCPAAQRFPPRRGTSCRHGREVWPRNVPASDRGSSAPAIHRRVDPRSQCGSYRPSGPIPLEPPAVGPHPLSTSRIGNFTCVFSAERRRIRGGAPAPAQPSHSLSPSTAVGHVRSAIRLSPPRQPCHRRRLHYLRSSSRYVLRELDNRARMDCLWSVETRGRIKVPPSEHHGIQLCSIPQSMPY